MVCTYREGIWKAKRNIDSNKLEQSLPSAAPEWLPRSQVLGWNSSALTNQSQVIKNFVLLKNSISA